MMKYTNKFEIPELLAKALATDHYSDPDERTADYSVTRLIAPVQEQALLRKYVDDTEIPDIMNFYHSWDGSVIHNAIEAAWTEEDGGFVEKRFYVDVRGVTVSGKIDRYQDDGTLIDWKNCRVYKIQAKDFTEWERQQNLYAYILGKNDIKVEKIVIWALLKDLTKAEAEWNKKVPDNQIIPVPLRLWTETQQKEFIENAVANHEAAKELTDDELYAQFPCSRHDQWSKYKNTGIIKKGSSKSTKNFDSPEEALAFFTDSPKFTKETHYLEDRYSKRTKCLEYCSAKPFCKQFKDENTVDI